MHPIISSHHNPKIKNVLALEKSRERHSQQAFIIEGIKELTLAVRSKYELLSVFFCPDIIDPELLAQIIPNEDLLIPVAQPVFAKITYRETTEGVLAIASHKQHELKNIGLKKNPFVVVLEGVEKPGNLGAILRTADAAAIDAVIICDPKTDFYNPNVIRSSIGCLFTVQTAAASIDDTLQWLKDNNMNILVTDLKAAVPYHTADYTFPTALILGTEATGISEQWRQSAHTRIIIPMRGKIDSMNVSNAAAVIVFEAMRQRGF